MTPNELKDKMSHDPRLDAFNSKFGRRLRDEYILSVLREAEQDVLVDTRSKYKEQQITAIVGQRAVNLPDDFLVPVNIRWKDPDDEDLAEGLAVKLVHENELL